MKTKQQKKIDKLFSIAESQHGYFTAKQAEKAGFAATNFPYHVKTGAWVKEDRSIYRLKNFSVSDKAHYMLYLLWSRSRDERIQGVLSHETALSVFELSDLNPRKIQITVPKAFRKSAKTPKALKLYFKDYLPEEVQIIDGLQVTKPFKTIIDLIDGEETSMEFIEQGFKQAYSRGLITQTEVKSCTNQSLSKLFKQWVQEVSKKRIAI